MNPTLFSPALGEIIGQTAFFSLGKATSLGEEKQNSKLKFNIKKTDLFVAYCSRGEVYIFHLKKTQTGHNVTELCFFLNEIIAL